MSDMDELLNYRDLRFSSLLRSDDLAKLKGDAEKLKTEIAVFESQKRVIDSKVTALQDAQRRLVRFIEVATDNVK